MSRVLRRLAVAVLLHVALPDAAAAQQAPVASAAPILIIDGDTLAVGPLIIDLHGIEAPTAGEDCRDVRGLWRCGEAAIIALRILVRNRELMCETLSVRAATHIEAQCLAEGEDLAARMLQEGLARAAPDAPPHYQAIQTRAQHHRRGLWR
ncbi:MAG: hypothetical protein GVY13_05930 [Alphaproteobacteria bacterium]|jgi:endonuclease YncB( thermonuclease family)|nr:hypothetical protein [Alphaproteobacteria bacterium]